MTYRQEAISTLHGSLSRVNIHRGQEIGAIYCCTAPLNRLHQVSRELCVSCGVDMTAVRGGSQPATCSVGSVPAPSLQS